MAEARKLEIGKWYRLEFPGTFAHVVAIDERVQPFRYLVESMIMRSRWWVDGSGKPNNSKSPRFARAQGES